IRLRNLTGMILIDFINMKDDNSYDILRDKITELARFDTQHTSFIDVTGLGIVELTRSKKDMSLREQLTK
ncbi:MAG: ribonuclease E/G, partial [Lachnospiraceae bacterium]|nr:ribonuclease E/G [Lachnospiraceae bacterium]